MNFLGKPLLTTDTVITIGVSPVRGLCKIEDSFNQATEISISSLVINQRSFLLSLPGCFVTSQRNKYDGYEDGAIWRILVT